MSPKEIWGNVLRIEKSSIYDGDGLRTVLFLKGCPLHCLWCSTPESQRQAPERGFAADRCCGCGACAAICPGGALSFDVGGLKFDKSKCSGCFKCAEVCPNGAVFTYGRRMSAEAAVREIAKDEIFYFHSGGGVTISGGEPLEQSGFVLAILEGCRDRGIDCALESSFFAPWSAIEPLLPHLGLLHVDIKHPDSERHKELVGVGNDLILENIRRADASSESFSLVTRTPLIPGINDRDEDIGALAEIAGGLKKLRFMEFLAYHRLGSETYARLGIKYPIPEIKTPSRAHMLDRASLFKRISGVRVKINGEEV